MVTIVEWRQLVGQLVTDIAEIKSSVVVVGEGELKDKIENVKKGDLPLLVSSMPSATGNGKSVDNISEMNGTVFFVLVPINERDTEDEKFSKWQETQTAMKRVKEQLEMYYREETFECLQDLSLGEYHQEPEYNYLGFMGWSLAYVFETPGY